ncbi:hypothetical protein JN11_00476 [Mucilaginibacter frigoritolerans]|uniref:DUF4468 domain-containing protein n=1 Tax=Mucilaginibacter frigoritolerans TaxID=652788 RepID=A0A562UHP6_9SPHI|nr:hypothetical protein [Mucilaginibacter frigoritolerans]TWJ04755.1 hypothetical protein JN11_00476 [Mucilaginibacter frigoritolerans]
MKTLFTKAFILIAIISFAFTAKAQQDYIITTNGDSINCKISFPLIGSPKYKVEGTNESKKIKVDKVKEYSIARRNQTFRAVVIKKATTFFPTKPLYMTVIEKGKINLYEMIYTNTSANGVSTSTKVWYVSKATDTVSELKTTSIFSMDSKKDRKDNFLDLIKDNKEVSDKYLSENKFSFKAILNLVRLYNTGDTTYKDPAGNTSVKKDDKTNNSNKN